MLINENDVDPDAPKASKPHWTVVCDFQAGGCGASCGYRHTKELAEISWNGRQEAL